MAFMLSATVLANGTSVAERLCIASELQGSMWLSSFVLHPELQRSMRDAEFGRGRKDDASIARDTSIADGVAKIYEKLWRPRVAQYWT